jgi:hypothetical protein
VHTFFGWGGEDKFSAGRILHSETFPWRGKFQGGELFRGNFTLVNLPELLYEISVYVLLSLYRFLFPRGDVKGNCPE